MHFNIEPFHFGIEDITSEFPLTFNDIKRYVNIDSSLFGIMIDDTGLDRRPFHLQEITNWLSSSIFKDCLVIYETSLNSFALNLIKRLPKEYLKQTKSYINIKLPESSKPILLAKFIHSDDPFQLNFKPSCALLTLSWYLVRMTTSSDNWYRLINKNILWEKIISHSAEELNSDSLILKAIVINYLPSVFNNNEEKVLKLFKQLSLNINLSNKHKEVIKNYYY